MSKNQNQNPNGYQSDAHEAQVEEVMKTHSTKKAEGRRVLSDISAETLILQRQIADKQVSADAMQGDVDAVAKLIREDALYFEGECKGYICESIVRDACYRAHGQRGWNETKVAEMVTEIRNLERLSDSELERVNMDAKLEYLSRLKRSVQLWTVRLRAAMEVHQEIVGSEWLPTPERGGVSKASFARQQIMAALNAK